MATQTEHGLKSERIGCDCSTPHEKKGKNIMLCIIGAIQ